MTQATLDVKQLLALCWSATISQTLCSTQKPRGSGENYRLGR